MPCFTELLATAAGVEKDMPAVVVDAWWRVCVSGAELARAFGGYDATSDGLRCMASSMASDRADMIRLFGLFSLGVW